MKTITAPILTILSACITITLLSAINLLNGQNVNQELVKEQEYFQAVKQARVVTVQSKAVQRAADKKTEQIITQTVNTITTLKEEVKQLKEDLNEANQKLDDATSIADARKFPIRAIPGSEEDW